jgi:hypothetical protein
MFNFLRKMFAGKNSIDVVGKVQIIRTDNITGNIKEITDWYKNVVTNDGVQAMAQSMAGDINDTFQHGEIGTDGSSPNKSNSSLGSPTKRKQLSVGNEINGDTVQVKYFFTDAELPNQDYEEFGAWINGDNNIGSGSLVNRVLFDSTYSKTAGDDTTIQYELTLNN